MRTQRLSDGNMVVSNCQELLAVDGRLSRMAANYMEGKLGTTVAYLRTGSNVLSEALNASAVLLTMCVAWKSAAVLRIMSEFLKASSPSLAELLIHSTSGILILVLLFIAVAVFVDRKIVHDSTSSGSTLQAQ